MFWPILGWVFLRVDFNCWSLWSTTTVVKEFSSLASFSPSESIRKNCCFDLDSGELVGLDFAKENWRDIFMDNSVFPLNWNQRKEKLRKTTWLLFQNNLYYYFFYVHWSLWYLSICTVISFKVSFLFKGFVTRDHFDNMFIQVTIRLKGHFDTVRQWTFVLLCGDILLKKKGVLIQGLTISCSKVNFSLLWLKKGFY